MTGYIDVSSARYSHALAWNAPGNRLSHLSTFVYSLGFFNNTAAMGTVKVLIIDHYDSYTNNILQLLQGSTSGRDGESYPEWSVAIVRFDQFDWYRHAEQECTRHDR